MTNNKSAAPCPQNLRPRTYHGVLDPLPKALRPLGKQDNWVVWRWQKKNGEWTKPPFRADNPARHAKNNDPSTWGRYEAAIRNAAKADGIGFNLLGTNLNVMDLDHCRDPESGTVAAWAQELIDEAAKLGAYVEVTVSGTGFRVIGESRSKERVQRSFRLLSGKLELYRNCERYITISGAQVGTCKQLPDLDAFFEATLTQYDKKERDIPSVDLDDPYLYTEHELVEEDVEQGERSDRFHFVVCTLLERGWARDDILALLRRHPNGIAARYSKEKRLPKMVDYSIALWRKEHADFKFDDPVNLPTTESFIKSKPTPKARLTVLNAHEVKTKAINWLWSNRLARSELTIISGDPGQMKSQITFYVAARLSRGDTWCDGGRAPRGNIFILSAEDSADTVIVPRLEAAGADLRRIKIVKATVTERNGDKHYFSLQEDLQLLAQLIKTWGNVALLIVDPVSSFMGSIDSHRTTDVRAVLGPLAEFAQAHNIAVLGIMHPPKAIVGNKAINAVSGSLAFVGMARLNFIALKEPEDDDDDSFANVSFDSFDNPRRLLLAGKTNLGPEAEGLGYRLGLRKVSNNIEAPYVEWDDIPVIITADEALAASSGTRKDTRVDDAKNWLREYLKDGPKLADEVKSAADAQDIAERTLARAKKALRVVTERTGFGKEGKFYWRLPGP